MNTSEQDAGISIRVRIINRLTKVKLDQLSHLICPMCGLKISLKIFDPQSLDLDIYTVNLRGLGRGGGFEIADLTSVLGDDVFTPLIIKRVFSLCKLFVDRSLVSNEDLNKILNFEKGGLRSYNPDAEDKDSLRSELEEATDQLKNVNKNIQEWKITYDSLKQKYDKLGQDWKRAYDELTLQRDSIASERDKALNEVKSLRGSVSKYSREVDEYEAVKVNNLEFLEELEAKIENYLGEERVDGEDIKDYIVEGLDKLIEGIESLRAGMEDE